MPCYYYLSANVEKGCVKDSDCTVDKACIRGACVDPCSVRGACGKNALCKVIEHRPRCTCPECYMGRPHVHCKISPQCSQPVIGEPEQKRECQVHGDCPQTLFCESGNCISPCGHTAVCAPNERCVAANHEASCQCKNKLAINSAGELTCPERQSICLSDLECPGHLSCINGLCQSPCHTAACPPGKKCHVLNHVPLCMCEEGCDVSVSLCLKDRGCPIDQACVGFKCQNPCDFHTCANGAPCVVENHVAVCKFCPPGFVVDANYGCLEGRIPRTSCILTLQKPDY